MRNPAMQDFLHLIFCGNWRSRHRAAGDRPGQRDMAVSRNECVAVGIWYVQASGEARHPSRMP